MLLTYTCAACIILDTCYVRVRSKQPSTYMIACSIDSKNACSIGAENACSIGAENACSIVSENTYRIYIVH